MLQSSGPISAANINAELQRTGSLSLNMQKVRALAGISSGPISFADLYGKGLYKCQLVLMPYATIRRTKGALASYTSAFIYGNVASDTHQLTKTQTWFGDTTQLLFAIKPDQNEIDPINFVAIKRVYGTEVEIYERGTIQSEWFTASNFILNHSHEGRKFRAKSAIGSEKYLIFMIQKIKAKWNRLYLIDGQGKEYLIDNFDSDYSNRRFYVERRSEWNNQNIISFSQN